MSQQNLHVKAGQLVCFSSGKYSSYDYDGPFVALEDISKSLLMDVERELSHVEDDGLGDRHEPFVDLLIKRGLLARVKMKEIHISNDGELEL